MSPSSGLIGERGREVQDFVSNTLGPDGMRRAVVVATPADNPPLMRLHGAWLATAIAEYFRDRGLKVLLLLDSLTRFAQAQREIALAIGEPPATKGYPPSVFARLPQLVERAGNSDRGVGSITAFYTVLVEGDDQNDPIADAARAILDGHIVLSRRLAENGLYPAIDVEASISRAMHQIATREQLDLANRFKQVYSTYQQNRDLITVGAYRRGSDPRVDLAVEQWPKMLEFLRQDMYEPVGIERSYADLKQLVTQFSAPAAGNRPIVAPAHDEIQTIRTDSGNRLDLGQGSEPRDGRSRPQGRRPRAPARAAARPIATSTCATPTAGQRRDGRGQAAELSLLPRSPGRGDAPASKNPRRSRARNSRSGARSGAKSASKPNRSAAWWIAFARKSGTPRIGANSAKATTRRCEHRVAARAETGNH